MLIFYQKTVFALSLETINVYKYPWTILSISFLCIILISSCNSPTIFIFISLLPIEQFRSAFAEILYPSKLDPFLK